MRCEQGTTPGRNNHSSLGYPVRCVATVDLADDGFGSSNTHSVPNIPEAAGVIDVSFLSNDTHSRSVHRCPSQREY
jgi:hypothetical protein